MADPILFQSQAFGLNQKLHLVVDDFTRDFRKLPENVTEEELRNAIQNAFITDCDASSVNYYAKQLRTSIIRPNYLLKPSCDANFRFAKSIQLSDFQQFCQRFFKQMKIVALIQGNLSEEAAKSIVQVAETNLDSGKLEEVSCNFK